MASTYKLDSQSYQGRWMQLYCTQTRDAANNQSVINWTLTVAGGTDSYYSTGPTTITINGEQVYYKARTAWSSYAFPAAKGSVSGSLVVKHNADGSKAISCSLSTAIYSSAVKTQTGTWTLDNNPTSATLLTAPDFNDEQNPTITYSNPSGNAVDSLQACISWTGGADIPYRDIPKTGGSYTFQLTDGERAKIWAAMPDKNKMTVTFYVTTTIGGVARYSTLQKTLSIVNADPTLAPIVEDMGAASLALTGDKNKIIRHFNYISFQSGAKARKGATITQQTVVCGDLRSDSGSGFFNNASSSAFAFFCMDSRGNISGVHTVEKELVEYIPLTCNIDMNSPELVGGQNAAVSFKISGKYFNGSFGAVSNTLAVEWRYKQENGEFGEWQSAEFARTNDTFDAAVSVSLDYRYSYTFQARAADKISAAETAEKAVKLLPTFHWSGEDFAFEVPVTIQGAPIDTIVEQGTEGIWTYRKWASGWAECWGWWQGEVNISQNMAGVYYSGSQRIDYPFTFKTNCLTVTGGSMTTVNWARSFADTTSYAAFIVIANQAQTATVIVQMQVKGTWK